MNAVITWVKSLKYLTEFPHLSMLSLTLQHAFFPVCSFMLMFALVFVGCGQAFLMALGPHAKQYNSMYNASLSLFRMLLGDFELHDIRRANPLVKPFRSHNLSPLHTTVYYYR